MAEDPHGLLQPVTSPVYPHEFDKVIQQSSLGREIHTIKVRVNKLYKIININLTFFMFMNQLFKPEGSSLGFSVVGLKSQDKGELGIFVQEIQPYGIAARYDYT